MKRWFKQCSFLLALALLLQVFAAVPLVTIARAVEGDEGYRITPELSDGITVSAEELSALTVQGTISGDSFTFAEDKTLSFTAVFGSGWSYNASFSNFFPSDKANSSVVENADGSVTFTYRAKSGQTVDLSDLENVILNATAEKLPTLKITIDGNFSSVTKDAWVPAEFELTLGTKQFASGNYTGSGSVKGRGNTSWSYPQKPYSIKLDAKASWLDIPKTKKYAIISNYGDQSMMRNYITYKTGLKLQGIDYTPKCEYVAVYLNGTYNGIYLLVERIDIESSKINITEAAEDNITGGYIIEKDAGDKVDKSEDPWFDAPFQANPNEDLFTVKAPDPVTQEMRDYLEEHMKKLHDALMGTSGEAYTKYIDTDSWVDFLIMQELSKNVDGNLKTSCYMLKERDSDIIEMTALWDFDNAYGTANWNNASQYNDRVDCPYGTGTSDFMVINSSCPWFQTLYAKPEFAAQVKETYTRYRSTLIPEMQRMIDEQQAYLATAVSKDNYWTSTSQFNYAVSTLRDWLQGRIDWLDARWLLETEVSVTPGTAEVKAGESATFTAEVVNSDNKGITWTISGNTSAATAISADGVLTVAADETAETILVTATSVADPTKSATATVTVIHAAEKPDSNVALNANVIAYNGGALGGAAGPEKLFDGKKTDQDNDKWCVDGNNKWVAFDIGEVRDVLQLTVYHAGSAGETPEGQINTANYEFYVLNEFMISVEELLAKTYEERNTLLADESYWLQIGSTTDNLLDVTTNDLTGTTGRIFKINISRADTTPWAKCVRVYELELSAKPKESPLVSGNADILGTGAATFAGEETEKAFDGDYTTKWCSNKTPNWVVFDIKEPAVPDRLKVTHAGDLEDERYNTNDFALQVLDTSKISEADFLAKTDSERTTIMGDDSYWTTVRSYTANEANVTDDPLEVANAVRIFRFVVTDGDDNWWGGDDTIRIYEIEVFGKKQTTPPTPVVDKTALAEQLNKYELCSASQGSLTANTWAAYTEAYNAGKLVNENSAATQDEVDAATQALKDAFSALEVRADQTSLDALQALIDQAEALTESDYTPATWEALQTALTAAKALVETPENAGSTDVATAKNNLQTAIDGLEKQTTAVDKSNLLTWLQYYAYVANTESNYTRDSWAIWVASYEAAQPVYDDPNATQEEVEAAVERMADAWYNSLVMCVTSANRTTLQDLIAQAEALKESDYASGWEAMQTALTAAKAIAADPGNTPDDDAVQAIANLQTALDGLVKVSVDKTALVEQLNKYELCSASQGSLTANTWAAYTEAYNAGKLVNENAAATQTEVDAATQALKDTFSALEVRADQTSLDALQALIDQAEALTESDYTPATWEALQTALTAAKALVETPENAGSVTVATVTTNLQTAIDGLVKVTKVDKSDLELLLDTYPQLASMESLCTRDSWAVWAASYEAAKPVYDDPNATQEEVDAAAERMRDAWNNLVACVTEENLATLQGLIAQAEALKESDYASGWEALQTALTAAKAIVADPGNAANDAAAQVIANLRTAIDGLVKVTVNKTALNKLIAAAEAMKETEHTAATWEALSEKLAAARTVAANANATQEQIDAAVAALQSAVDGLVKAGDATELKAMLEAAGKLDLSTVTEESAEAIRTAMENAQKAIAARDTQAALDAAAAALDEAVKNAEQKPVGPTDPDPTDPQPTQPVDPDTPHTGDRMEIMLPLLAVVALGAMAAIVLLLKKRRTA